MKIYLYFGVIAMVCSTYATELGFINSFIGNSVNKDYPGMCFYNETQTPIAVGSSFKPKDECVEIFCREDFVLKIKNCPFYQVGKWCEVTFDKDAEFPNCCAKIICPDSYV